MDYFKPIVAGILIVVVVAALIFGAWSFERYITWKYDYRHYYEKTQERIDKLNNRIIGLESDNNNLRKELKNFKSQLGYD